VGGGFLYKIACGCCPGPIEFGIFLEPRQENPSQMRMTIANAEVGKLLAIRGPCEFGLGTERGRTLLKPELLGNAPVQIICVGKSCKRKKFCFYQMNLSL
jgi:hypothetical protein